MPTYDYRCDACGHRLEVVHGVHGHGPRTCPSCGAEGTLRKLIAAPAVHFKGSGWAKKDRSATAVPGTSQAQKTAPEATPAADGSTSKPAGGSTPKPATSGPASGGSVAD